MPEKIRDDPCAKTCRRISLEGISGILGSFNGSVIGLEVIYGISSRIRGENLVDDAQYTENLATDRRGSVSSDNGLEMQLPIGSKPCRAGMRKEETYWIPQHGV